MAIPSRLSELKRPQATKIKCQTRSCFRSLRKYRAYAEGVTGTFKPVIMFKSAKVAVSLEANKVFNELIQNLNVTDLLAFIKRQQVLDSNDNSFGIGLQLLSQK